MINEKHNFVSVSYNTLTIQFDSPYVSGVGLQTSRDANIITTHVMQKVTTVNILASYDLISIHNDNARMHIYIQGNFINKFIKKCRSDIH